MSEKQLEIYKQAILKQLKASLEGNMYQKLTPELATGFFNIMEAKINEQTNSSDV